MCPLSAFPWHISFSQIGQIKFDFDGDSGRFVPEEGLLTRKMGGAGGVLEEADSLVAGAFPALRVGVVGMLFDRPPSRDWLTIFVRSKIWTALDF